MEHISEATYLKSDAQPCVVESTTASATARQSWIALLKGNFTLLANTLANNEAIFDLHPRDYSNRSNPCTWCTSCIAQGCESPQTPGRLRRTSSWPLHCLNCFLLALMDIRRSSAHKEDDSPDCLGNIPRR